MKTPYDDKVKTLVELKNKRELDKIPLTYSIEIHRSKPKFILTGPKVTDGHWSEVFTWFVEDAVVDSERGRILFFEHLLTIIDHMASSDDKYKEALLTYVSDAFGLVLEDDNTFNR